MILKHDFFSPFYNEGRAIVVTPPCRRMIRVCFNGDYDLFGDSEKNPKKKNFFLSIPYTVFGMNYYKHEGRLQLRQLQLAFAKSDDCKKLYVPPLYNIEYDGTVCVPLPKKQFPAARPEEMFKACVSAFWATEFTEDANMIDSYDGDSLFGDFARWQRTTRKKPLWVPSRGLEEMDEKWFDEFMNPQHLATQYRY